MKGTINPDHIPDNKYTLMVLGAPNLTITNLGSLEEELKTIMLPDNTRASGGDRDPTENDITMPLHHKLEQAYMEAWYKSSQDPVAPDYKRPAVLIYPRISGAVGSSFSLLGVFPTKRVLPEGKMDGDGEGQNVVWTLSIDDIIPIQ
jgi:hypothetical protein